MPFTPEDVKHINFVPGTTAHDYRVFHAGDEVGVVRLFSVVGLIDAGTDPSDHIAARLNELEEQEGLERVTSELSGVLEMH